MYPGAQFLHQILKAFKVCRFIQERFAEFNRRPAHEIRRDVLETRYRYHSLVEPLHDLGLDFRRKHLIIQGAVRVD